MGRLQNHRGTFSVDQHSVRLEAKLLGKPHRLAATRLEDFGESHEAPLEPDGMYEMIYAFWRNSQRIEAFDAYFA